MKKEAKTFANVARACISEPPYLQKFFGSFFQKRTCFCLALLFAWPASAKQLDIPYGHDQAQTLDLYPADGAGPHKLVVFLHGGGWVAGQKGVGRIVARALNPDGYTVASVGYRLVPQTDMAGAMSDAAHATAWLLAHAKTYDIDPTRFAVMGHSSGATMAALLGTDQSYLKDAGVDPKRLAAVVVLDGVFDVQANVTHYPSEQRAEVFGNNVAGWQKFSAVDRLASMQAHPRFCVLHEDTNARFVEQISLFEAALKKQHETLQSATAPGLTHGQLIRQFDDTTKPMAHFTEDCLGKSW